jgi:hypothetical protein
MKRILQIARNSPLLILALVILAANWQLLFGLTGIKWDSSNYWHPWRYFISQCYTNGIVPLWNPYTQSGYPIHGDLQGPAYSIDAIVTSFFFKGSVYSLNIIYLGYLIFGAYGFYKLCVFVRGHAQLKSGDTFVPNQWTAVLAGIVYALSGYVTAHGHNLYIVVSVSLLPWLYYYYFRIWKEGTIWNAMKCSVIVFFQITAGNPSFLIVSIYIFVVAGIVYIVQLLRKKEYTAFKKSLVSVAWAVLFSLLLCAPVLLNAFFIFSDSTRGAGVSLDWAGLENSPGTGLFSFFQPLIGFEHGIDSTVRQPIINYYIGALSLLFAFIGFVKFKSPYLRFFGVLAVVSFFLSLGLQTPLFGLLHKYLPFFNVFRMPKLIFIYDVFYLLILFSLGLNYAVEKQQVAGKQLFYYLLFAGVCIAGGIVYFKVGYPEVQAGGPMQDGSLIGWFKSSSQVLKATLSGIISVVLLIAAYFILKRNTRKYALAVLILAEVVIYYNITSIVRVFDETDLKVKEKCIAALPKKFPVPENLSPKEALLLSGRLAPFWMNASIYLKQPDFTNNNSFALATHAELEDQHPEDFNYIINKPYVTFIDSLRDRTLPSDTGAYTIAVCDDASIHKAGQLKTDLNDAITCTSFLPNAFTFSVTNKHKVGFLLQQSWHRFWTIKVNGVEQTPIRAFYSFPLLLLQPGKNTVTFHYEVPYFKLLFILSLLIFSGIITALILRVPRYKYPLLTVFAGIAVCCVLCFFTAQTTADSNPTEITTTQKTRLVHNVNTACRVNGTEAYNFIYPQDVAEFIRALPQMKEDTLVCNTISTYFPPELERLIEAGYGSLVSNKSTNAGSIRVYRKGTSAEKIIYEEKLQDTLLRQGGIEVSAGREFSKAIRIKAGDIFARPGDLVVLEAEMDGFPGDYPGLCFSLDNNGQNKKFLSDCPIRKGPRCGRKMCVFYTLPETVEATDEIGAFFWNNKPVSTTLRGLSMKVIRKTE